MMGGPARPLVPIVLCFVVGIWAGEHLPAYPEALLGVLVGALLAGGIAFRSSRLRWRALFLASGALGMLRVAAFPGPLPPGSFSADPVRIEGRVDLVASSSEGASGGFLDLTCPSPGGKVRVWVPPGSPSFLQEDRVSALGVLRPFRGLSNPGSRDAPRFYRRRGFIGRMTVKRPEEITLESREGMRSTLAGFRAGRIALIRERVGEPVAGLLAALWLGEGAALEQRQWRIFRETGMVHFLVISGFNLAVLLGGLWWLGSLLGIGVRLRAVALSGVAVGYAALVGWQAPVFRATVLALFYAVGVLLRRRKDWGTALAGSALVILWFDPFQLFDLGFQLSFLACLGIFWWTPVFLRWMGHDRRIARGPGSPAGWLRWGLDAARGALAVSLAAWLAVAPLIAFRFHLVTPFAWLANLPVLPWFFLLVPGGFCFLLAGGIHPAVAGGCLWVLGGLGKGLVATVEGLSALPGGSFYWAGPSLVGLWGYYALALVFTWHRALAISRLRLAVWALLAGNVALLGGVASGGSADREGFWLLDTGHGLAAALRDSEGRVLLYDCGSLSVGRLGGGGIGERVIAPALWAWGVRRIDAIVLSHPDGDHWNGLEDLLERFPVGSVYLNPHFGRSPDGERIRCLLGRHGVPWRELVRGDRPALLSGWTVEVLHPPGLGTVCDRFSENDCSTVLLCRRDEDGPMRFFSHRLDRELSLSRRGTPGGGPALLFTGDLDSAGVDYLLGTSAEGTLRSDLLLVPHHGSALASNRALLDRAGPRVAWLSGREGFADEEGLRDYAERRIPLWATWRYGALRAEFR
jgi:competence protein ComEC